MVVVGLPLSLDGTRGPAARAAEEEAEALADLLGAPRGRGRALRRAADHGHRPPGADRRWDQGAGPAGRGGPDGGRRHADGLARRPADDGERPSPGPTPTTAPPDGAVPGRRRRPADDAVPYAVGPGAATGASTAPGAVPHGPPAPSAPVAARRGRGIVVGRARAGRRATSGSAARPTRRARRVPRSWSPSRPGRRGRHGLAAGVQGRDRELARLPDLDRVQQRAGCRSRASTPSDGNSSSGGPGRAGRRAQRVPAGGAARVHRLGAGRAGGPAARATTPPTSTAAGDRRHRAVAVAARRVPASRACSAPGTYTVVPGETDEQLLGTMVDRFDAQADAARPGRRGRPARLHALPGGHRGLHRGEGGRARQEHGPGRPGRLQPSGPRTCPCRWTRPCSTPWARTAAR